MGDGGGGVTTDAGRGGDANHRQKMLFGRSGQKCYDQRTFYYLGIHFYYLGVRFYYLCL